MSEKAAREEQQDISSGASDSSLRKACIEKKLSHSYEQSVAGEGRPMDEVFAELENIERLSE